MAHRPVGASAALAAALVWAYATAGAGQNGVSSAKGSGGGSHCLDCHAGIEGINAVMNRRWEAHTNCVACHKGVAGGRTVEAAHDGLIAKPGDLRVVMQTCGHCHSRLGATSGLTQGPARDVVDRVLRSPMATAAGEIAAVRYLWGEQSTPAARYGVRSVSALDPSPAPGTVPAVAELPHARNSPADHLLRTRCLQCHLWTQPARGLPPFRGAGCAACHVPYAPDGRSRSGDPTISKTEVGRPLLHRIERYVPDAQCLTCHRAEGLGIGWNFVGWLSRGNTTGVATPTAATAVPVPPDVHAAAGMACIDCHDTWDVHGDGHVYERGRDAVGISCESCHGTPTAPPTYRTARGHPLTNVERRKDDVVLIGKISGEEMVVPRLDTPAGGGTPAHRILGHQAADDRAGVTCVACHAGEVTEQYLRHFQLDERQAVPQDWAAGLADGAPGRVTPGRWSITPLWNPIALPMLGVNADGRADALLASFHGLRTIIDATGREVESGRLLHTQDGRYGVGFRTADPHRTQTRARSCVSCHAEPAALGLGSDRIDSARFGWPLRYAPDQVADGEGTAIMAFSMPGERPLNFGELSRTLRGAACLECHVDRPPAGALPADHAPVDADRAHRRRVATLLGATPAAPAQAGAPGAHAPPPSTHDAVARSATGDAPVPAVERASPAADAPDPSSETPATRPARAEDPELSPFIGR